MDPVLTFLQFAMKQPSFNSTIYKRWTLLFPYSSRELQDIIVINNSIIDLLEPQYSTFKLFKKLLRNNNVTYKKVQEGVIEVKSDDIKLILLKYGNNQLKNLLLSLPHIIQEYDSHLLEMQISSLKTNYQ